MDLSSIEPQYLNCIEDIEEITNEDSFIKEPKMNINLSNLREKLFPEINPKDIVIEKERVSNSRVCYKRIISNNKIKLSRNFMPKIYIDIPN